MSAYRFMSRVTGMRYGDRIIRSLFAEFVDLERVAAASDEQLARLPGIGKQNVRQLRTLLDAEKSK